MGRKNRRVLQFESKYTKNKEEVTLCGQFITDSKVTSAKGTRYDRIFTMCISRWASYADAVQQGKDERTTSLASWMIRTVTAQSAWRCTASALMKFL